MKKCNKKNWVTDDLRTAKIVCVQKRKNATRQK